MKKNLMNKFTLKILSLAVAILLWLLVVNIEDPVRSETYWEVPVTIVNESYLTSDLQIPLLVEGSDTVTVRIQAKSSVLGEIDRDSITAEADMTQIISMDTTPYMVPVRVNCPGVTDEDITVIPANIPIETDDLTNQAMTISASVGTTKPESGYEVGKLTVNPEKVTISGPEDLINKLDRVVADVDVSGMYQSGSISAPLHIYDKNGDELTDTQMSYLNLQGADNNTVSVDVDLWRVQTDINIQVDYSGTPEDGYQVSDITTVPSTLSVAGTEDALKELADNGNTIVIPASEIDVSGENADFEQTVDIEDLLPDDIMLARDISSSVIVSVTILPYDSKEYVIPSTKIDRSKQAENMTAVIMDESVTVRVRGSDEDLENLKDDDIKLSIDTSKYTKEGEQEVPVNVTLPEGYELVDDITVRVNLTPSAERQSEQ